MRPQPGPPSPLGEGSRVRSQATNTQAKLPPYFSFARRSSATAAAALPGKRRLTSR
jgi:hypothetical protein